MIPPDISVVMGVRNGAAVLPDTLSSTLRQQGVALELIAVDDGSTDATSAILDEAAIRDPRLRVIHKRPEGLTRALIDGCAAARGKAIARIDAGDAMTPDRLRRQKAVLDGHPGVVLVTCRTDFCGPAWEPLYTVKEHGGGGAATDAWVADVMPDRPEGSLRDGPTHHGSVLIAADAYRAAGGYRAQFYYSQDWDLWYRMAEHGKFAGVRDVLYRCRVFPEGISMRNMRRQRQFYDCARAAFLARRRGESEDDALRHAADACPRPTASVQRQAGTKRTGTAGHYYIGEALRRNRDLRCRTYFLSALKVNPLHAPSWFRLVQSFGSRKASS